MMTLPPAPSPLGWEATALRDIQVQTSRYGRWFLYFRGVTAHFLLIRRKGWDATLPLTDSQGVSYQASLTLLPVQTDHDTVAFQTAALFGDNRYLNTWYGVDPQQSQRSGYSRYSAPGGFYGIDNSLTWSHQFDAHWGTLLSADYTWLGEHANESPIVLRRNEAALTAAVIWTF